MIRTTESILRNTEKETRRTSQRRQLATLAPGFGVGRKMNNKSDFCELILNRKFEDQEIRKILSDVLETDVCHVLENGESEIHYTYEETDDSIFPSILDVYGGRKTNRLLEYQGVDLAKRLFERHQINSLIDPCDLIPGLMPYDPYWYLLLEDGKWFLADTSGSRLEDPRWPSGVRKEAEIEFDRLMIKKYYWSEPNKKLLCQPDGGHNSGGCAPSIVTP